MITVSLVAIVAAVVLTVVLLAVETAARVRTSRCPDPSPHGTPRRPRRVGTSGRPNRRTGTPS